MKGRFYSLTIAAGSVAALTTGTLALTGHVRAQSSPAAALDLRTVAVSRWLGHQVAVTGGWRAVHQSGQSRYQSMVIGVGLVEVDAASGEVDEMIFEAAARAHANGRIPQSAAGSTAYRFATGHFAGMAALVSQDATFVDHGAFSEYRFTWRARAGEAWLPTTVTVGVNAATGQVAYYWSSRIAPTVATVSRVTARQAAASAISASGIASGHVIDGPTLDVQVLDDGAQRLVWVSTVAGVSGAGFHMSQNRVVWTDPSSGASRVVASS